MTRAARRSSRPPAGCAIVTKVGTSPTRARSSCRSPISAATAAATARSARIPTIPAHGPCSATRSARGSTRARDAGLQGGADVPRRQARGGVPGVPRARSPSSATPRPSTYVHEACEIALDAGLLPHTNAGVLSRDEMARLRPVNVSLGLMLENVEPAPPRPRRCRTTMRPTRSRRGRLAMIARGRRAPASRSRPAFSSASARRATSASTPRSRSPTCTRATATSRKSSSRTSAPRTAIPMADAPEPTARRHGARRRRRAPRARRRHERAGAAESESRRPSPAAARRHQRLGRHLAA